MTNIYLSFAVLVLLALAQLRMSSESIIRLLGVGFMLFGLAVFALLSGPLNWKHELTTTTGPTATGYVLAGAGAVGLMFIVSCSLSAALRIWVDGFRVMLKKKSAPDSEKEVDSEA